MSEHNSIRPGFVPRGARGLIGWGAVAIVAFVLGGLFFGGDKTTVDEHGTYEHATATSSESSPGTGNRPNSGNGGIPRIRRPVNGWISRLWRANRAIGCFTAISSSTRKPE